MNNKKRLIAIIAGLTMSAASIAGLSACNNSQHQHSWKEEWTPSATEHWHDPACDDTTEVKDKGAHVWDEGTVVTEATHTTPGQKKYTCETCGYEKTESIPASGHTYSDELGHDDNFHWKVPNCDCENLTEAELKKDKAEHVLVPVVDEQPTDTTNGKQHYECSTKGCDYATKQETLYNYIGDKLSGGDKVTVGNVEVDTTVIAEQDKNGNAWTGAVKLTKLNAASKTFVYDLHVSGTYAGSWVDAFAWKRFGIQVTENTGFYVWNNTNDGGKICIRKFTADNKTNCGAECNEEVLVSGAAEATYGWITGAVFGEDGADLRITRVNDKLNLYVKNADGYQYIGTVTCGDEANEFALYGVTAEYTFSGFEVTALTHVEGKAPSASESGYFEHYYTGADESKVYYDANGKLTIWDKLERPAVLETVEITLQTKKDGQTAAFSGATVKVDGEDVAVTGGKITLENIEPNTELVITADDYTGKLKVTAAAESVVLEYNFATATGKVDLSHMNDNNHAITVNGAVADYQTGNWSGSAKVNIIGENADKNIVIEFTVKNVTNSQAGWPTDDWASQRFAIQAVKSNRGFLFFEPNGECNIFDMTDGSLSDSGKTKLGREDWVGTQLRTTGGAKFRIVRVGSKLVFMAMNAESKWQEIGTIDCGEAENEIILYACGVTYEFSGFEVTALTHVDEKAPSASESGYFEHYYTGADESKVYYDANGKLTAWDKLERPAVLETVEITLQTKKDGQTATFSGTTVKVDGKDVAVTGGKITLENIEPNTELVITAGDYTGTLKVTAATADVVLEYNYATATGKVDLSHMNDNNHAITVTEKDKDGNAWTGLAVLNDLNETSKTFVYDLHVSGTYAGSWNDAWAYKRFGIQVTENTGFYLWVRDNAVTIRKFTADNKTNCGAECNEEVLVSGDAEATYGWISNAVLNADGTGADLRITRVNDKLNLYVKNADGYQYIGTVTCGEEANSFALYGVTAEFTFSGFEVTALTHVEATTDTAEHYYTGEDADKVYYDANGKLTTLEKLTLTTE